MGKKLVFVHPDGLHQIIGDASDLPTTTPPVVLPAFEVRGRVVPFSSLVRVTHRAAFYQEPMVPASYTFHEQQR